MEKELQMLEEDYQVKIHPDALKLTLKKSNKKNPGLNGIHRFWFKKTTSIHDRLATDKNECIQKTEISKWVTKGKTILMQKDPLKKPAQTTIDS